MSDKIVIDRAVAKQVLDTLCLHQGAHPATYRQAITALRAVLAQQDAQTPACGCPPEGFCGAGSRCQDAQAVPQGATLAGWLREWEGDDSDLGQWLFAATEEEKDDSPNWRPVYWLNAAPTQPVSDVTEAVTKTVIEVEKMLCEKLGKPWQPSGMSIKDLVDELAIAHQHFEEIKKWKEQGDALFSAPNYSLGFHLGAWWADRPWRTK